MSDGSQNLGDEQEVVGEPVSEPHQAAVVGEPPEEVPPVLGEPVHLANGGKMDQQSVSSPSADKPSTNGVHGDAMPSSELPPLSIDAPSATATSAELSSAEDISAQDRSIDENAIPSEPATEASQIPSQDIDDAKSDVGISSDAEITHITDAPTPPPENETASTENPYSVLDEDPQGSNEDITTKEESAVADRSLDATPPVSIVEEALAVSVPPVQDGEPTEVSGTESPAGSAASPVAHKEAEKGLGGDPQEEVPPNTSTNVEDDLENKNEEIKVPELNTSEEVSATERKELDASSQDEIPEENSGMAGSASSKAEHVVSREVELVEEDGDKKAASEGEVVPELGSNEKFENHSIVDESSVQNVDKIPGKVLHDEVEQVVMREAAAQPEAFSEEKVSTKEFDDQGQSGGSLSSEVLSADSSEPRAISLEDPSGEQKHSEEAAFGENGIQHDQDGIPLEGEQGASKDDSEGAEGKEKPTSRIKLPFIFTTLAIAVAGVAVASFSRSRP